MSKAAAVLFVLCACWHVEAAATTEGNNEVIRIEQAQTNENEPEYAKWSRLAFHEASKIYTLLDYRYIGQTHVAPGVDQQQFRFWVKKKDAEFPLIVSIRYNPVTQKEFSVTMEEERRGNVQLL
ncbi:DUF3889 domain-containing protein [Paenibacillus sp. SI8]|uniref:DUF3889 domain-containing protein n=1 Tax=unclassified Paenibacillus TaxID=185978 RepID=UPI0034655701